MRNDSLTGLAAGPDAPEKPFPFIAAAFGPEQPELLSTSSLRQLCSHPLLCELSTGSVDLATLRELLVQHHFYSRNFTRFLCLLVANLPEIGDVRALMQNLLEELGVDQRLGASHADLFLASMRAAGATTDGKTPLDGTNKLTGAMFRYCRDPDPLNGLAAMCLGAEAIVPVIYTPVIKAMKHLGLPEQAWNFFQLHVAEDEGHAAAMMDIIRRLIRNDDSKAAQVQEVANDMILCRVRFLDDVWTTTRLAASSSH